MITSVLKLDSSVFRMQSFSNCLLVCAVEFGQYGWTARNTGGKFSNITSALESWTTRRSNVARTHYLRDLLRTSRVGTTKLPVVIDRHAGKTIRLPILRLGKHFFSLSTGLEYHLSQCLDAGLSPLGVSSLGYAEFTQMVPNDESLLYPLWSFAAHSAIPHWLQSGFRSVGICLGSSHDGSDRHKIQRLSASIHSIDRQSRTHSQIDASRLRSLLLVVLHAVLLADSTAIHQRTRQCQCPTEWRFVFPRIFSDANWKRTRERWCFIVIELGSLGKDETCILKKNWSMRLFICVLFLVIRWVFRRFDLLIAHRSVLIRAQSLFSSRSSIESHTGFVSTTFRYGWLTFGFESIEFSSFRTMVCQFPNEILDICFVRNASPREHSGYCGDLSYHLHGFLPSSSSFPSK